MLTALVVLALLALLAAGVILWSYLRRNKVPPLPEQGMSILPPKRPTVTRPKAPVAGPAVRTRKA